MIPPLPIAVYPANTLEGMIARKWVQIICECEGLLENPEEPVLLLLNRCRELMNAAKWLPTYQHIFLVQLRNDLTELTEGHPVTRQFIEVLNRELESN